jgi:transposase
VPHIRHARWSKKGIWQQIFETLSQQSDNTYHMLDATILRAHQHNAGAKKSLNRQAISRSQSGLNIKIHALCDGKGRPIAFHLTGGEAHDLQGADALLEKVNAPALLADKAYYAQGRVLDRLKKINCSAGHTYKKLIIKTSDPMTKCSINGVI